MIRLTDLRKIFVTDEVETHAVSGVHLDVRDGEYVSIAGPSGCGKTTLLSILGLLDTPRVELPALMNPVAGDIWYNSSDAHRIIFFGVRSNPQIS